MNPLRVIGRLFVKAGKGILAVLRFAERKGLTDDLLDLALTFVTHAQVEFADPAARRAWVVNELKAHTRAPDSIINLVVELAVQAYKAKVAG